jgi:hypothetical protein
MAQRITLLELEAVVEPLVVTTDFVSLANRSVRRLYSKAATPGNTVVYHFGGLTPSPDHNPSTGGEDLPLYFVNLPPEYSHASSFIVSDGDNWDHSLDTIAKTHEGTSRGVIPLEATFCNAGFDHDAFIDYGNNYRSVGDSLTESGYRIYAVPYNLVKSFSEGKLSSSSVRALVRKAYIDVVEDDDLLPFDNIAPMRLAILATAYEDQNDLERASTYWNMALSELESDSGRYRGQQILNITYDDPAAFEVTETIN